MKQDSISTSEFMEQQVVETSSVFTDFSTIAARGHNVISRARRNGRWWVLKSLEEKVRNTEPFVSMLRKEFDIMASLQDPNIVNVVSIEEVDKLGLSIVMEWIDGVTLGEWLKEPHSKKEKLRVLHQLITTLAYVHQHQTAHRDLKPSNVMVTHRGNNVKLIDFGLSDTDSFDYMKVPAGTVGYRAPEVEAVEAVEASATINYQRADIYSLGRIMRISTSAVGRILWCSVLVVRSIRAFITWRKWQKNCFLQRKCFSGDGLPWFSSASAPSYSVEDGYANNFLNGLHQKMLLQKRLKMEKSLGYRRKKRNRRKRNE